MTGAGSRVLTTGAAAGSRRVAAGAGAPRTMSFSFERMRLNTAAFYTHRDQARTGTGGLAARLPYCRTLNSMRRFFALSAAGFFLAVGAFGTGPRRFLWSAGGPSFRGPALSPL